MTDAVTQAQLQARMLQAEADLAEAERIVSELRADGREAEARQVAGQRVQPLLVSLATMRADMVTLTAAPATGPIVGGSWARARRMDDSAGGSRPLR